MRNIPEQFLGMMISNLFFQSGIKANEISNFDDYELKQLLESPEKLKAWNKLGVRFIRWNHFIDLAGEVLMLETSKKVPVETKAIASLTLSFMALEECVNSFIQDCLLARNYDENEIRQELESTSLSRKLDTFMKILTKHSLKKEEPLLWKQFKEVKKIRDSNVHNKLVLEKFISEGQETINLQKTAREFIEAVPRVNAYLRKIRPSELIEMESELKRIWSTIQMKVKI